MIFTKYENNTHEIWNLNILINKKFYLKINKYIKILNFTTTVKLRITN